MIPLFSTTRVTLWVIRSNLEYYYSVCKLACCSYGCDPFVSPPATRRDTFVLRLPRDERGCHPGGYWWDNYPCALSVNQVPETHPKIGAILKWVADDREPGQQPKQWPSGQNPLIRSVMICVTFYLRNDNCWTCTDDRFDILKTFNYKRKN